MYPVIFDPRRLRVVLVGAGEAVLRRLEGLEGSAAEDFRVFSPTPSVRLLERAGGRLHRRLPVPSDLAGTHLVLVAGLDDEASGRIAAMARAAGIPVNVEDRPEWCDFHVPAVVRRGDLLLTASTGGRSPGLAGRLRERLESLFGPEWEERMECLAEAREGWRAEGCDPAALARRTGEWIDRRRWFG
ncbi:MAG TPA: bifunctional precorrin-2 dehydrogenase/sirohydrochlorin ferrochelatase [Alphaproteobacteria bacterium]|jgi:precorrin-2 dehydrogenase/sirohydrochlorin ferrochelatase